MASMYTGLKNEGATCYMNSMLQSLFFTNEFRRIIFSIDTSEEDVDESFVFWLQIIFVLMEQRECESFYVKKFLETFGWADADTQEDIEEYSRQLIGKVEEIVHGTPAHADLCALYSGELTHTIRCDDGYERSNIEPFWNMRLYIGDSDNIFEAIISNIEPTTLDEFVHDDNQQTSATQDHLYSRLPNVLQIQLMRFQGDGRKSNKRVEFHNELDLSILIPDKIYKLHSVLVHSGTVDTGHYKAYISPKLDDEWFLFNDSVVKKVPAEEAIQGNWGNGRSRKSAYMLVYAQSTQMNDIDEPKAPRRLSERINRLINTKKEAPTDFVQIVEDCVIFEDPVLEIRLCSIDERYQLPLNIRKHETLTSIFHRIADMVVIDAEWLLIYDSDQHQICMSDMHKSFAEHVGIRFERVLRSEKKKLVIYYERSPEQASHKDHSNGQQ